ncbi:MAG: hypothetical protein EOM23_02375 [Candidatus Moranbacteria bacterium]|nr:hypothetical protein [Candidatus Moranbacteria bacterium]
MNKLCNWPEGVFNKILFFLSHIFSIWIFSAALAVGIAGTAWMIAMTKLELSTAYPFIGLTFVLVLFSANIFLNEPITFYKALGTLLIILGIALCARG